MSKYLTCYDVNEEGKAILHKPFLMKFSDEIGQKIITLLEEQNKENKHGRNSN